VSLPSAQPSRATLSGALQEEVAKLTAFFRRDLLMALSYRVAFITDWFNLILQVLIFFLVSRLVDASKLPSFGGDPTTYVEFATVGIAVASFMQIGLTRVMGAIRGEQLMGTLETLFSTPTAPTTIQLGSVVYDVVYVPVRTVVFLLLTAAILDVRITLGGILPTVGLLLVFIPLVWGIGMISSAAVLTLRRGDGLVGFAITILIAGSSTYVPLRVMPSWARGLAAINPISTTLDAAREALLGNGGWSATLPAMAELLPLAVVAIAIGILAFRLSLKRERRLGTLGLY
jgi:ABC-type multidrug transport system permease subunit